jgi:hypothetical protein
MAHFGQNISAYTAMISPKPFTLSGFEPGSTFPEADAISTTPRRQRLKINFFIVFRREETREHNQKVVNGQEKGGKGYRGLKTAKLSETDLDAGFIL